MKTTIKMFSALLIGLVMVTSCKKDADPADRDLFVGTYRGQISYQSGEQNTTDANGAVTVSKVGDLYKFIFGSGVPDVSGIRIEKSENTYVGVSSDGVVRITIDASNLDLYVQRSGAVWTAKATR